MYISTIYISTYIYYTKYISTINMTTLINLILRGEINKKEKEYINKCKSNVVGG